jgi:hypothetical protein
VIGLTFDDILEGIPATKTSFPLKYLGLPLSVWQLKRVDFQHLEDKCSGKLPTWGGKYITMAGRTELVRSIITSQATCYLTPLVLPLGTISFINKIERAFLWSAKDTTTGAKCKVNWETVCRPKKLGGLGVMNLDKFAMALRLRWPWLEWKDSSKIWAGSKNPCSKDDMEIFYAATTITIGDGRKTPFWEAPWLDGSKPIDLAPLIFASSKRKAWNVKKALEDNAWVRMINLDESFTMDHLTQFVALWIKLQDVHLHDEAPDDISWKLTANGQYSAKLAYHLQFLGSTFSSLHKSVWKVWAPPKVKFFAWLLTQNRIWTADRLQKRGWPNCGLCPLCKQVTESVNHLFIHCRFAVRLWCSVRDWLGLPNLQPSQWAGLSINSWWDYLTTNVGPSRKARGLHLLACPLGNLE